jgi:hypothetical protein
MTNDECQMTKETRIPKSEMTGDCEQYRLPVDHRPDTARKLAAALPLGTRHSSFIRVSSFVIRHWLAIWLLVALALPGTLCGQTNAVKRGGNRFLLIVDTSASMAGRKEGVLKALRDLLASSMQRQLREGDTLGLWTFNQDLAGRFPLQHWSAKTRSAAAASLLEFINNQKYEGEASLDKILTPLGHVIKGSANLTVVLISDGEEKMHGTPFDDPINAYYKQWQKEQQKARLPFVTVLRAGDGQITDYAVTASPWPLEMPALPSESKAPEDTASANDASLSAPSAGGAPPTLSTPANRATVPDTPGTAAAAQTNLSAGGTTPTPAASSAANTAPEPISAVSTGPASPTEVAAASSFAPASSTERKMTPPDAAAPKSGTASAQPSDAHSITTPGAATAAQGIVAVPPAGFIRRKGVMVAGALLIGATLGLALLLRRRARAADHVSLITHSLEREKKRE